MVAFSDCYDAVLHHITSQHVTSQHVTSHHITSHHTTSYYITSYHIRSHHIISDHIILCHITLTRYFLLSNVQTCSSFYAERISREDFSRDMAAQYEPIRVCKACSRIYRMLDWSRTVLDGPTVSLTNDICR